MNTTTHNKKTLRGRVIATTGAKTAVVLVERYVKHPKYGKYLKRSKKYQVHDPAGAAQVGAQVTIVETAPVSKTKHFKLVD
jgi:small subunit ribosomal protein S17